MFVYAYNNNMVIDKNRFNTETKFFPSSVFFWSSSENLLVRRSRLTLTATQAHHSNL